MNNRGFVLWPIILITTFAVGATAFVVFKPFESNKVNVTTIDQTKSQLSAARDLKGTWQGIMSYTRNQPDFYSTASGTWQSGNCAYNYLLRLVVNSQTDTTITGTDSYSRQAPSNICESQDASLDSEWSAAAPFKAGISSSRITSFDFSFSEVLGPLSGSFTTDTITVNPGPAKQVSDEVSNQLNSPINLLRQK